MKRVLAIAGSDSGGGAGIQADLKAITALGGYGMTAITAITAQNTVGVQAIHEVPPRLVEAQIDSVVNDIGIDAVKTGMLFTPEIVALVARKIRQYRIRRVVVDPVMVAKSGDPLLKEEARRALQELLIPVALLVTPNLPEAEMLCGFEVSDHDTMREAARKIHNMGARNVLVKGGHLEGEIVDILYDGKAFREYTAPRIPTKNTHGTGCTFASAIATELAKGKSLHHSVLGAKALISSAIRFSLSLGKGHGPTNPHAVMAREAERFRVVESLENVLEKLKDRRIGRLIPEVQSNLGYALPYAETEQHVAAFPGRIVRLGDSIATVSGPAFGASRHVASIILTVMARDPAFRSAMNIRFSEEILSACQRAGLRVSHFDRAQEPPRIKKAEGFSLEWGTKTVLKEGKVPDIIFDRGEVGKEPMVRVLGKSPAEVARKVLAVQREMER